MRRLIFSAALFATVSSFAADDLPAQARAALEKATAYIRSISTEGGYLWKYSLDLKERAGETKATATQIWVQPPGTPSMGLAFLRCYEATKDARYLDAAKAAADALARGQVESGGWDYPVDFDPVKMKLSYLRSDAGKLSPDEIKKRKNLTTFDDDTTQSGMRLLLAVGDTIKSPADERDRRILAARDYGLKKMLEAQYPNGAWPQRWRGEAHAEKDFPIVKASYPKDYPREHPKQNYYTHYTLNDNSLRDCIGVMLDAFHRLGKREHLESAKRGGDFLILAQMPEPQPAWAQQYNTQMEPAWARAFEPPAITGGESVGALRVLLELYAETGEERFLKPVPAALAWFGRSEIAPGKWARYYELHTNRQIFGDRDGKIYYSLAEISEERQHGYSWSSDYGLPGLRKTHERLLKDGREKYLAQKRPKPLSDKTRAERMKTLDPRVRETIAALDPQGRWITKGSVKKRDWEFNDRVETSVFIENAETLADYLEAAAR